jgi:hypothetical protein
MEQVVECIERPVLERFGQQMMTTTVFFLPRINVFAIFFSPLVEDSWPLLNVGGSRNQQVLF